MGVSDFPNYGKKVPITRPIKGKRQTRHTPIKIPMPFKGARDPRDHTSARNRRRNRDDTA